MTAFLVTSGTPLGPDNLLYWNYMRNLTQHVRNTYCIKTTISETFWGKISCTPQKLYFLPSPPVFPFPPPHPLQAFLHIPKVKKKMYYIMYTNIGSQTQPYINYSFILWFFWVGEGEGHFPLHVQPLHSQLWTLSNFPPNASYFPSHV